MTSIRDRSISIIILSLLTSVSARGESTYDQPYLGAWPEIWARYSARHVSERAELGPAGIASKADLIFLGAAQNLTEIRVDQPVDRIEFYESDVNVLRVIKGNFKDRKTHLKFPPSATGIENGAQHVFLMEMKEGSKPAVIEAWYVYPASHNLMRVVGAYNCSKDVGMDVLQHLVSGEHNTKLPSRLLDEYRSDSWDRMYSAVVMAAAVAPEIGKDVLVEMVSAKDRKRFDLQLFCLAAHSLAAKQGDAGLRVLLKNIPQFLGTARVAESVVFDLVAKYGTDKLFPDLKALVHAKPEFAVSAAFAIAGIGGASGRDAIRAFLNDNRLASRSETISDGSLTTTKSVPELLKKALNHLPESPR